MNELQVSLMSDEDLTVIAADTFHEKRPNDFVEEVKIDKVDLEQPLSQEVEHTSKWEDSTPLKPRPMDRPMTHQTPLNHPVASSVPPGMSSMRLFRVREATGGSPQHCRTPPETRQLWPLWRKPTPKGVPITPTPLLQGYFRRLPILLAAHSAQVHKHGESFTAEQPLVE